MKSDFRFRKSERLKSRKSIGLLFSQGQSLHAYPIRAKYRILASDQPSTIRITFSAPKRNLKRAVDRNTMKRRMREAYRLSPSRKELLNCSMEVMFIFSGKSLESYASVKKATDQLLQRLINL